MLAIFCYLPQSCNSADDFVLQGEIVQSGIISPELVYKILPGPGKSGQAVASGAASIL
jgi:hypothetical protein